MEPKKYDIKGTGSPDEYFFEAYKIQAILYVYASLIFILGCPVEEKNNYKGSASFNENPY